MQENLALVNGRPRQKHFLSMELLQGASVFTTFRTSNGEAVWWDEHLARLLKQAKHFDFHQPTEIEFRKSFDKLIAHSVGDLRIRFTLTATDFIASAAAYEKPAVNIYEGIKVVWSEYFVHPQLAAFKTGNYLPYLLGYQQARKLGAFEALMCTEQGLIVDGSRTSPLFYQPGKIIVPTGGLDSITRAKVVVAAEKRGVEIEAKPVKKGEHVGQLLLASSTIGLVPVNPAFDSIVRALVTLFCPYATDG